MKKCPGCEREIDKFAIACQYCGKISEAGYDNTLDKGSSAGQVENESEQNEDKS